MTRCRGITRRTISKILHHDPTLTGIYTLSSSMISHYYSLPMKNAINFHTDLHHFNLKQQIMHDLKKFQVITIVDEVYPTVLKTIKDPPLVLYTLGDLSLLSYLPALSVIGTRNPSREAKLKMNRIVKPLIEQDWLIVSGMAIGIDSFAHLLSLGNKGKTIAVLGGGFNHIYPRQNIALFRKIAEQGLLLTEYPPDTAPEKYHFPERNRIISGLSFGTLVIEATRRSGTMITVDQALDQGREVYAVPGSPLLPQTEGCHQMIQDGAKLVHVSADISDDWETIGRNLFYI
jgi:DNA processing protein